MALASDHRSSSTARLKSWALFIQPPRVIVGGFGTIGGGGSNAVIGGGTAGGFGTIGGGTAGGFGMGGRT